MSETYGLPQSLIPSMTQTLRAMKRLELGVYNCVASAVHDAQFVEQVAACRARWPLLANVRCGAWYVERPSGVCAFKSTDGHSGNWSFSTVRLNLHTAAEARRAGGCVIADATRRGKVFPDAMSKTIPIWAAVLNRAARALGLVEGGEEEDGDGTRPEHDLRLPPWIPASEREQILPKIDAWVTDLRGVCCEETLRQCLPRKPLRCYWIAQQASEAASARAVQELEGRLREDEARCTALVLVSASRHNDRGRRVLTLRDPGHPASPPLVAAYDYVPGAGDDEESWARNLTPAAMWAHRRRILEAGPGRAPAVVSSLHVLSPRGAGSTGLERLAPQGLVSASRESAHEILPGLFAVGDRLAVGGAASLQGRSRAGLSAEAGVAAVVDASLRGVAWADGGASDAEPRVPVLSVPILDAKRAKHALENALPRILLFVAGALAASASAAGGRVAIVCDTGKDAALAIATAYLLVEELAQATPPHAWAAAEALPRPAAGVAKHRLKQCLAVVSAQVPDARPSQGSLRQVVAAFCPHWYSGGVDASARQNASS